MKTKIWFTEDNEGNVYLNTTEGDSTKGEPIPPNSYAGNRSPEFKKEMQRGRLYLEYNAKIHHDEIYDYTAFACDMSSITIEALYTKEDGSKYLLAASTVNSAESSIYPYISDSLVAKAKQYLQDFYASESLQKKWQDLIIRPICFLINIETKEYELVSLSSLKKKNYKKILRRGLTRVDKIEDYELNYIDL